MTSLQLSTLDLVAVALYFLAVAAIGIYASSNGQKTTSKYFVADGRMPHWAVAFTLMATLISSNTLVAHPGIVFKQSMVLVPGFLALPIVLYFVAQYIVPFYRRVIGMSAYEYIEKRFGLEQRLYSSFGFTIDRTFDVGVTLMTTALVVNVIVPQLPIGSVLFALAIFTMLYTMIGGIAAVVWTDVMQGIILMGGGVLTLAILLFDPSIGPPLSTLQTAWDSGKFSFGPSELSAESLRQDTPRSLWVFLVAMALIWTRKYVSDQNMVQRYLLARSTAEARKATLLGACLSVPILIGFNLIGAALYGYYQLSDANPPNVADKVLPHFIINELPSGIVGLLIAAILAASMSSISSDLNSIATVINKDYFQRFLPRQNEKIRMIVARISVLAVGTTSSIVGVWLIPDASSESTASRVLAYATILSAGTLGLFCLGFFTRRATRQGALAGIIACLVFSVWATSTSGTSPLVDLGPLNWKWDLILIGVFAHFILFGVGLLYSISFGGFRPKNLSSLVFSTREPSSRN